ncbi:MAG: hypothetical protein HWN69_06885 [Desulfobacterales bacterium]|nr:hypothetical protein [Desulfobacterales bacterium]
MEERQQKQISGFVRFLVGTVAVSIVVPLLNWQIQSREVEIKELEQLGKFVEHALNENIAVRQRFAEYFATVSRSERMRGRWHKYKSVLDKEEKETKEKVERLEQKKNELVAQAEKRLKEVELELQKLEEQKRLAMEVAKKEKIKNEIVAKQTSFKEAVAQRARLEEQLSQVQSEIKNAKAELVFPIKSTFAAIRKKTGWVYLGEFDDEQQAWVTAYFDIPTKGDPKEVVQKKLSVTAASINVRTGMPSVFGSFRKVTDVLNQGETVEILEVARWQETGYVWARVRY